MEDLGKIAHPYAVAAFNQAREEGDTEGWSNALGALALVVSDRHVKGLIASPGVDRSELAALLVDVTGQALGSPLKPTAENFVRVLADNRRLDVVADIAQAYEFERSRAERSSDVKIVSAFELSASEQDKLASSLRQRLGTEIKMSVDIDPALIGGVIIRSGDTVIDASISGRLQELARAVG
ncbi:MAG: F0F1 ATP synthase subunit delta [Gammaproteobacteria bacterium]